MEQEFSEWVNTVDESVTSRMADIASRLENEGEDIINMSTADPDFVTPSHIRDAAVEGLTRGETGYPPTPGLFELRKAIAQKLSAENGVETEPEQVYVTPGSKFALLESIMTIVLEGDEVIIFEPAWISHEAMVKIAGGTVRSVPLDPNDNFSPDLEAFTEAITDDTKLVVLNTPSNPTGNVFAREELETIRDLCVEHDCWVLVDEVYEKIVFEGEHISIASLPGMAERTVTVNGFSKGYAMTGWRVGYVTGPEEFMAAMGKFQSHSVTSTAIFAQRGAIAAINGPTKPFEKMNDAYKKRRDVVVDYLRDANRDPPVPRGGLSAFIPVGARNDIELCETLLESESVATTPGTPFGGSGFIRICLTTDVERIKTGMERILNQL